MYELNDRYRSGCYIDEYHNVYVNLRQLPKCRACNIDLFGEEIEDGICDFCNHQN